MSAATSDRGCVLITGTSTGIGRATALWLDRAGYRVFAAVRKTADGERLQAEASPALTPLILDVTRPDQIAAAVETVQQRLGPDGGLQALVNNAGVVVAGPLECIDMARVRSQFDVNVFGHLAVTQAFLPLVRRGRGRIVTVISTAADSALPFLGPYCASKSAAFALFIALRRELRWFGIPVSLMIPGFIAGPIWDTAETTLQIVQKEDSQGVYRQIMLPMFAFVKPSLNMAASQDIVAKKIHRVLQARWPRATYRVGPGSQVSRIGDWLPEWLVHATLKWYVKRYPAPPLPTPADHPTPQPKA